MLQLLQSEQEQPKSGKRKSRQIDLEQLDTDSLLKIIPLYNKTTRQPTDLEDLCSQCNELFLRKKKLLLSLALFIAYYHMELKNTIETKLFLHDMASSYLSAFNEDQELEEATLFY